MSNFLTADWHLLDENIIKYCKRPFGNTNHLKKTLIRNVNEACGPEDDLWIVGDFSMRGVSYRNYHNDVIERIKCRVHLIVGNHDKMTTLDYIRIGFVSVHSWFPLEEFHLIHEPYNSFTRTFPDAMWLCGHVHLNWFAQRNRLNVGVDMWSFKPVSMTQVRDIMCRYEGNQQENQRVQ